MTVRKRYHRQGKLGPLYPGRGVGKAGAGTSAKDSPVCAGIRKRVCTLYGEKSAADRRKEISAKRRELSQAQRRIEELDRLFQRLYEDNVSGKISDERFAKLSGGYEAEQKDLQEKVAILQAELTGQEEQAMNLDRFLAIVKKYTEIEKLTPTILNEFVEKIIVHAPDKSTGKRVQQVEISYNCVGVIELPDTNEMDSKTA